MGAASSNCSHINCTSMQRCGKIFQGVHGKAQSVKTTTQGKSAPNSRTGYVRFGRGPLANIHVLQRRSRVSLMRSPVTKSLVYMCRTRDEHKLQGHALSLQMLKHSIRHEAECPHLKDKGAATEPDTNYKRAAAHHALPQVSQERLLRLSGICRQQAPAEALSLSTSQHLTVSHQSGCSSCMQLCP